MNPAFGYFLLAKQKKVRPRRKRGTPRLIKPGNHQPRSFNISRNRFGAGFNGVRTVVHGP
jgi:hypothetical protein